MRKLKKELEIENQKLRSDRKEKETKRKHICKKKEIHKKVHREAKLSFALLAIHKATEKLSKSQRTITPEMFKLLFQAETRFGENLWRNTTTSVELGRNALHIALQYNQWKNKMVKKFSTFKLKKLLENKT